jgi:hypothetical protein
MEITHAEQGSEERVERITVIAQIPGARCDPRRKSLLECTITLGVRHEEEDKSKECPMIPEHLMRKSIHRQGGHPVNSAPEQKHDPCQPPE